MKFDVIVGNPPYGKGQSEIHLRIMNTILDFCNDKLCFIMPRKPIIEQVKEKWMKMFKEAVCTNIQTVKKGAFKNTNMDATAIYYCDRYGNPENYDKQLDVDDKVYEIFPDEGHKLFIDKMSMIGDDYLKISYIFVNKTYYDDNYKTLQSGVKENCYYLNVNRANGAFGAKWISNKFNETDILTAQEELEFCKINTAVKNIIECPNIKYAENLKTLMIDGKVLRYGLWLTQKSQDINDPQFKYVPNIKYDEIIGESPRELDKSLLLKCNFTEDEAEIVLKYLDDFNFSRNRNDVVGNTEVDSEDSQSDPESSQSTSNSLPKTIYDLELKKLDPSSDIPEDEKYKDEDLKKAYPDQYELFFEK